MHVIVITQEKTIQNIEGFDKTKLKHADTAEKVVLPDEQGNTARPADIVCRKALINAAVRSVMRDVTHCYVVTYLLCSYRMLLTCLCDYSNRANLCDSH